jgi:hypothetical protein
MNRQSENKVYCFNGKNFRLRNIDLGVLNKAAPLLLKFRRLQFEYTKDIDDTELRKAKAEIEDIKTALSQLETGSNGNENEICRLKDKLRVSETEFENNSPLQSMQKLINDAESLALFELLTDRETILPFLKNVLEAENCSLDEINFDKPGVLEFIRAVVTDFFLLTLKNKKLSLS